MMRDDRLRSRALAAFAGVALPAGLAGFVLAVAACALLAALGGDAPVWVSPLGLPTPAWNALVAGIGAALALACVLPLAPRVRRTVAVLALVPVVAATLDTATYYALVADGALRTARAVPASRGAGLALTGCAAFALRGGAPDWSWRRVSVGLAACGAGGVGALVVLILAFGNTDYRRPADCIVVLGARVYADGTPSLALADRVAQGVDLWQAGLAPVVVMSGGVDPGHGASEARVMARLAEEAGVPAAAIVLDERGVSTRASAVNCAALAREHGLDDALLVSHGYHLLRAKAAFARAGLEAFSVPAAESRRLARRHTFVVREGVGGLWYARPRAFSG
jgi:uncharacterized SAM-binding protein YcdF (DUF218 family)